MNMNITVSCVNDDNRLGFLPKHFGKYMLKVQSCVYQNLRKQCIEYQSSPWDFFELSNRGAYLAPHLNQEFLSCSYRNGYSGSLTPDAAGIVATLYALNYITNYTDSEALFVKYSLLLDFVGCHKEAFKICAAITL